MRGCCVVQGAVVAAVQVLEVADQVAQHRHNGAVLLRGQLCAHSCCWRVSATIASISVFSTSKAETSRIVYLAIPLESITGQCSLGALERLLHDVKLRKILARSQQGPGLGWKLC